MQAELERVRNWAKEKIQGGSEPPWAWYQYMKLIEAADAILEGMAATSSTGNSQRLAPHRETHLRLVDSSDPQDSVQSRRDPQQKPLLPM